MKTEWTWTYPAELEQAWAAIAARMAPGDLSGFEADVARISNALTTERDPRFGRYAFDARSLVAYGLFFFPQTYARMVLALDECLDHDRWRPPVHDGPLRILDLGAGAGAATFAALFSLGRRLEDFAAEVEAADASPEGLRTLAELFDAVARPRWPRVGLTCRAADLRVPGEAGTGAYDLVLASFVLNELLEGAPAAAATRWLDSAASKLAPGGLLVITEPVSRTTSERIERLRDAVAAAGHLDIVAPCLHRLPCPLLAAGEVWCHEVRRWPLPDTVSRLNRRLHRQVETVKFSLLAVAHRAPETRGPANALTARLVAPLHVRKGRITTWGCAADGDVHTYEVQTRSLDRAAVRAAERIERGARVTWGSLHPLGDQTTLRSDSLPQVE